MRRTLPALVSPLPLLLVALLCLAGGPPAAGGGDAVSPSALEPAATGGVPAVERALARLTQHRRLLVVGAHPDDEDTTALTLAARGLGGEAAYLSLSRGEGGQNLIGPELGVDLGLLRSRELLAARRIDGARQLFTRAYDFGYTRSLEETYEHWPREVLLEDAARAVRRFRPQVIVSVFPRDARGGHGQHQAAGVVTHEVFERAGEAGAFPELAEAGLEPWSPAALFRATWWDPDSTTLETELGRLDPWTGKTLFQLAMASRSQHRSQDMGRLQPVGPEEGRYAWVAGPGGPDSGDLFSGIDTRLEAIAALLPPGEARDRVAAELAAVRREAEAARASLTPAEAGSAAGPLLEILGRLRTARGTAAAVDAPGARAAAALVEEKEGVAREGLLAAAGIAVDAWTESATAVPGEPLRVEAVVWRGRPGGAGTETPATADPALPVQPAGIVVSGTVPWQVEPARDEDGRPVAPAPEPLAAGDLAAWALDVTAAEDAAPTAPYFLERPLRGALYGWSAAPPRVRGEPFGPPPLTVRFLLRIGERDVAVEREVVQRRRDQALGEVRRPVRVVPRLEVAAEPGLVVWSTAGGQAGRREVTVHLRSHAPEPLAGTVRLELPDDWPGADGAPEPAPFEIAEARGEASVALDLALPGNLPRGRYALETVATLAPGPGEAGGGSATAGREYRAAFPVLDYPHVRATPRPRPAVVELAAADVRLPDLEAVGFVLGASDRVPEALAAVGLPVVPLTGAEMAEADLSRFDAVVVGSRAYETDPALARNNARLLDYARFGGLVIVLYQQYPFVDGGHAPYPLEIARPHDRVTEEDAPATLLEPDHPALTTPNRIGPEDWEGWVQERGLYFAHTWDDAYRPLLSFPASPGYESGELRGGLLVAELGQGTWVYTGLAFFRQLPAGVTGAYRLFANLLGLGQTQ